MRIKKDPMIEREKQKINMKYLMKIQKNAPQIYRRTMPPLTNESENPPIGENNNNQVSVNDIINNSLNKDKRLSVPDGNKTVPSLKGGLKISETSKPVNKDLKSIDTKSSKATSQGQKSLILEKSKSLSNITKPEINNNLSVSILASKRNSKLE